MLPCTAGKQAGQPGGLCRALIGHPELSTPDHLLISFFNDNPHLRWEGRYKLTDEAFAGRLAKAPDPVPEPALA